MLPALCKIKSLTGITYEIYEQINQFQKHIVTKQSDPKNFNSSMFTLFTLIELKLFMLNVSVELVYHCNF